MIPKQFDLHGTKWNVVKEESATNSTNLGQCHSPQCKITIQSKCMGEDVSPDMMDSTFYHELIHAFLIVGEYHDLSDDEHFVSYLGNCLHQYEKSKCHK